MGCLRLAKSVSHLRESSVWRNLSRAGRGNKVADRVEAIVGITYVAYSPLSRGLLTDTFKTVTDLAENDMRRIRPRFQPDVFDHNFQLANAVGEIAKAKGVTTAQVALAWVRGKGAVPIFSATTRERIRENLVEVELSEEEMETLEQLLQGFEVKGGRYPVGHEKYLSQ